MTCARATLAVLLAWTGLLLLPAATGAATLRAWSDAELVRASDVVVRGRVIDVRVVTRPGSGVIETVARVAVAEDYTGDADDVIEIRELGGSIGAMRLDVPGAARFIVGDDIIVALEHKRGYYRPITMGRAVFGVRDTPRGTMLVRQGTEAHVAGESDVARDASVADAAGMAIDALSPSQRSLASFRSLVTGITGRPVRQRSMGGVTFPFAGAASPVADGPTMAGYTLLGMMRWNQPDANQTVWWYRNTLAPAPQPATTTDAQLQTATAAWTAPAQSTLTLAYGGTRYHAASSLLNCAMPPVPGGGLVTFEDPNDDITTAGVIAIGGACSTSSGGATVNGQRFSRITYGFVIFTTKIDMPALGNSLFLARVATHEIGHAIGLGHTQTNGAIAAPTTNLMYPSCCHAGTPVPPAIGQDDLAGLVALYPSALPPPPPPPPPPVCTPVVSPTLLSAGWGGGTIGTVSVSVGPTCTWTIGGLPAWLSHTGTSTRTGAGSVTFIAGANGPDARSAVVSVATHAVTVSQAAAPPLDTDGDGLPDAWELQAGLDPLSAVGANGAHGDPDGDGRTNIVELQQGTHPRGMVQRYLAEGVDTDFFATRLALVNPSAHATAHVQLRLAGPADGAGVVQTRQHWLTIPPQRRATVDAATIPGLSGAFATTVEADTLVVVDRTVSWDAGGYGSTGETATASPRTTWYFAEGATGWAFNTFYLLLNPGEATSRVTVTYLRDGRAPKVSVYDVRPGERVTVWVDMERWPDGDSLAQAEVSARIDASQPIIAERAMYLDHGSQLFTAGHASLGLTAPATRWSFAEGATGPYFDLFLLLANPTAEPAVGRVRFLVAGAVIDHPIVVPPFARQTVWVDALGQDAALAALNPDYALLADAAVSSEVVIDNGVGVLAERSMWWPGTPDSWREAHNSGGVTETGTAWVLAEGEVGGARNHATYILVANAEPHDAVVRVTLFYEDRDAEVRTYPVAAHSRFNIPLGVAAGGYDYFTNAQGRRVGALVESIGTSPVPITVERAMYSDADGQPWAAGHNAVATRIRD